jgi:hypothetical protein
MSKHEGKLTHHQPIARLEKSPKPPYT